MPVVPATSHARQCGLVVEERTEPAQRETQPSLRWWLRAVKLAAVGIKSEGTKGTGKNRGNTTQSADYVSTFKETVEETPGPPPHQAQKKIDGNRIRTCAAEAI